MTMIKKDIQAITQITTKIDATMQTGFTCPMCYSPLTTTNQTWVCDGSLNMKGTEHPFDVARQGYVNLLPVQNKKSKMPGDSQDSILARQRFLQAGFYQPLQQSITQLINQFLPNTDDKSKKTWLDIGCGDGYYTHNIAQVDGINQLIAIDISKPAVMALAKKSKQNNSLWTQINNTPVCQIVPLVTSASNLPLVDEMVDGISSIFSPILPNELSRVLKQNGIVVIAKPDEGHLSSLRSALFDEVREHNSDKFLEQLSEVGFELLHTEKVESEISVNTEQLEDLLTMTPYSYRAKREKREILIANTSEQNFSTMAKFVVYVLSKK